MNFDRSPSCYHLTDFSSLKSTMRKTVFSKFSVILLFFQTNLIESNYMHRVSNLMNTNLITFIQLHSVQNKACCYIYYPTANMKKHPKMIAVCTAMHSHYINEHS